MERWQDGAWVRLTEQPSVGDIVRIVMADGARGEVRRVTALNEPGGRFPITFVAEPCDDPTPRQSIPARIHEADAAVQPDVSGLVLPTTHP